MRTTSKILCALSVAFAAGALLPTLDAQSLTYTKGQNVAPAYEGWEQDADGSRYFLFGYMNRNWVEEVDVPVGPDNTFTPGGPDVGQPTHFLPRRNRFVFRVPVPKNFTEKDELIWTLTSHGVTEKAWASVRADYLIDDVVKASETGALGAGTSSPEVRGNKPPAVRVEGPKALKAKVGEPLTITAVVTDDGIPKPRVSSPLLALFGGSTGGRGAAPAAGAAGEAGRGAAAPAAAGGPNLEALGAAAGLSQTQVQQLIAARRNPELQPPTRITVGKVTGLHLSWFVYRGTGKVTFSPDQVKPWEDTRAGQNSPWAPLWQPPVMPADGKIAVQVTFTEPGTYALRGLADDGALFGADDVTVTVSR